jgi:hypothetical protein
LFNGIPFNEPEDRAGIPHALFAITQQRIGVRPGYPIDLSGSASQVQVPVFHGHGHVVAQGNVGMTLLATQDVIFGFSQGRPDSGFY